MENYYKYYNNLLEKNIINMDKLIVKIFISLTVVFFLLILYLGTSDFIVNSRLIESELNLENK